MGVENTCGATLYVSETDDKESGKTKRDLKGFSGVRPPHQNVKT